MIRQHRESRALVTLAVQVRKSTRALLFDGEGQLRGRAGECECECECEPLAFCGIHVLSPRIFPLIEEEGAFSIIDAYLRLAAQSEKIVAFRADEYRWCDLGRVESLREAEAEMSSTSPSPPLL
jgi:NDP-sugar pyrophosphorylase family protein